MYNKESNKYKDQLFEKHNLHLLTKLIKGLNTYTEGQR